MAVVAGVSIAACSTVPGPPGAATSQLRIDVSNGTQLDIAVVLDGAVLAVVQPGGALGWPAAQLPPRPWSIETRTATGRAIGTATLGVGHGECVDGPDGSRSCDGALILVDFVCGRFVLTAGSEAPSLPAPASDGGEPCVP
jgi:hypothetical protein